MSNQVYSNDSQKYYAMRGLNFYTPTPQQSLNPVVSVTLNMTDASIQAPGLLDLTNDVFTVLEEGVYTITACIACQYDGLVGVDTYDPFYRFTLAGSGVGYTNIALATTTLRQPALGSGAPIITTPCLTFTGFFSKGSTFSFTLANLNGIGGAILITIPPSSAITICKIA